MLAAVFLLMLQSPHVPKDSGAYLDPGARELVARARARRATAEQTIVEYHALVQERISLGLRALRRDRMFYRREMVGRVAWRRGGPDSVVMVGAREAIPVVSPKVQIPEDLVSDAPDLAFQPGDDKFGVGIGDSEFVYDPIAAGSEARYQFRSGDTTRITLQGGRTIELLELRIIPRSDDFHLLVGSFWFEQEHCGLVRAVFKPARPWDMERDLEPSDSSDAKDIPGFLKPIRGEVRYLTVEYALWENKWWLPRLIAADVVATAGSWLAAPMRYERVFSEYSVQTGPPVLPAIRPSLTDSVLADSVASPCDGRADCHCHRHQCRSVVVVVPLDTASLLTSPALSPSIYEPGEQYMSRTELRDLGEQLKLLPQTPWRAHAPSLTFGLGRAGLIRYNRVEALSLGARGDFDFGRLRADALARIGPGDWWLNLEAGLTRETADAQLRLAGYRRLAAANPDTRPLGFGNSANALFLGRDDGEYFHAWGAELVVRPAATEIQSYTLRLFTEWQRNAPQQTDFSLPHAVNDLNVFRPNIHAATATEMGAGLTLRGSRGISSRGATLGEEVTMDASVGDYNFARFSTTTRVTVPLPGRLVAGTELGAGASGGVVPVQSLWFLGGPATLRGYAGGAIAGPDFWRGRLEVANSFPGARVALFSDAGWAGRGVDLAKGHPLIAAGAGVSFFDGLIRFDLARALRAPTGWRFDMYLDAIL
jgi:hypothetical protein